MLRKSKTKPIYEEKYAYRVHFYYNKKQYRSSYIDNHYEAKALEQEVNEIVSAVKSYVILSPEDIRIDKYIFSTAINRYHQEYPQQQNQLSIGQPWIFSYFIFCSPKLLVLYFHS
ncbi:hypothetical protein [Candidatus Uabimicrobium sp. HlEnr_7]|uniref:hypothetical protein n=1 Tax=Candidatus Uabimicrobium helgolandensis TaxID=3095367 RepID=UPI003558DA0D